MESIKNELNIIEEIYNNHYYVLFELDNKQDILKLIDHTYKYVWIIDHSEFQAEWTATNNTLFSRRSDPSKVMIRRDSMEILMETDYFYNLMKENKCEIGGYHFIQTNIVPPHYLSLEKFKGKKKYDMLTEHINYLFEVCIFSDYTRIISSKKDVIEDFLKKIGKI